MHDPMEMVAVVLGSGLSLMMLYAAWIGVRWWRRKLEPAKLPEGADLERLHDRLARLEETEHRLAEVEERLDFTERMLAQAPAEGLLNRGEDR
jgi:hypothetical protein